MSGMTKQTLITNGAVRQDIEAAKRELIATKQLGYALDRVGRVIERELGKLTVKESKEKFLRRLSEAVSAQVPEL